MIIKELNVHGIKPECVERYREMHRNIWPELEEEYRRRGFRRISCFMNGPSLLVYMEYDEKTSVEVDNPVEREWLKLMDIVADKEYDSTAPSYELVYSLEG